jgi:predicted alpha-1,2-mannosidase
MRIKPTTIVFWALSMLTMGLQAQKTPADYVNPFVGASTSAGAAGIYHGLGKTFPGATTPYGLVQVSPNTITGGDNGPGYSYEHTSIEGFAFTQMSGIGWYGDLGNFLVIPATGALKTFAGKANAEVKGYRSAYDKKSEEASAGYYSVLLTDYGIKSEMTAAPHSGILRFTFPANKQSRIQIDLARRVGGTSTEQYVKVVNDSTIEGWMKCTPEGGGWGNGDGKANYTVYFYAQFSKPLKDFGVWTANIPDTQKRKLENVESDAYQKLVASAKVMKGNREMTGKHLGFYSQFSTKSQEQVMLKTGISFVSIEGARRNLSSEISGWDFNKVKESARDLWNTALSKIRVEGGTEEEKAVFYSALYHTMIDPRDYSDVDKQYTGGDGKAHLSKNFTKRTVFSGWDVFRSQFPLQTIINPELVSDMLNSLTELADQTGKGYFERWEFLNAYSGCMLGNPAVVVLADAYAKRIRNYDVSKAYGYAVNSCEKFGNGSRGYTPNPLSISYTLEYAYTEWCVSQLAHALGKNDDEKKYALLAQSYRNIFDTTYHWFRPRNADGSWEVWPAEGRLKQWYGCMESNPYQQGWFVPHDIDGMVKLMGGREKVLADLANFFEKMPSNLMWNDYYNHPNEPVHHVPFLFNRLNEPWNTQKWSRIICRDGYHNTVEGLVGNEDVGQMSAWYVLVASGLAQICPGDNRFEITSPVFSQISIQVPSGGAAKTFKITAHHNSRENIYIQSARLNGQKLNRCYIDYQEIMSGGELELEMGNKPNKGWGIQ